MKFKDILIQKRFYSHKLEISSRERIRSKTRTINSFASKNSPSWAEALPRTFILLKQIVNFHQYKYIYIYVCIYNLHLIVRPTSESKNEMGPHVVTHCQVAATGMGCSVHGGAEGTQTEHINQNLIPVKLTATKLQGQNPLRPTLQTNTIACIPFSGYDYVIVTLMLED